ncbi:stalk domain-containing protein [Paenibacillus chitinolyticus]|uniref:stalk domain-containing protein n=1 Tax=Paenibacillus chitinolyticus TaxID=79263 RepID=UPI0035E07BF5
MKKYVVGALFGFVLAFAASANAEVRTMIDKIVEGTFPVTIEGKKLETDAVVIEGSTYLPVRAFGEAVGYDVKFDSKLGVSLEHKKIEQTVDEDYKKDPIYINNQKGQKLMSERDALTEKISSLYKQIEDYDRVVMENGIIIAKEKDDYYYSIQKEREALMKQRDEIEKEMERIQNESIELMKQQKK